MRTSSVVASEIPPRARLAAARSRIQAGGSVRLAMRGVSMLPLLHAPMEIQVEPLSRAACIGDVIVFEDRQRYVVHRVVGYTADAYVTSGDAQPHITEIVPPRAVLGRLSQPSLVARIAGPLYAYVHPLRVRLLRLASLNAQINPLRRPRSFATLRALLAARLTDNREAFAEIAVHAAEPQSLIDAMKRHRCAPLIAKTLRDFELARRPELQWLYASCVKATASAVLNTDRLREQIGEVLRALGNARVDVVLLKGAARLYLQDEGAELHPSCDVDVLVAPEDQNLAVNALYLSGYRQPCDLQQRLRYLRRHHHAAPLFRKGRHAVEVHVALAPPGRLSSDTSLQALRPLLEPIAPGVFRLGRAGTVYHLAIHGLGALSLRDAQLMAAALRGMNADEVQTLRTFVRRERREATRVGGTIAFAAAIAGVPWQTTMLQRAYALWLLRRGDLPRTLRTRAQLVEAGFAGTSGGPVHAVDTLLLGCAGFPQFAGRCAAGAAAGLYAFALGFRPERAARALRARSDTRPSDSRDTSHWDRGRSTA